jgi:urease accessory protein
MVRRLLGLLFGATLLMAAGIPLAHAHHVMDYALPATALQGLLSGLGHPVLGIDHLLFVVGAGVLAAHFERGFVLPFIFVVASAFAALVRYLGADLAFGELPIAGSLVILGAMMLAAQTPREGVVAILFLAAGTLHGHALAESIVGAERTPLIAYLAGLTVTQCAVALAVWRIAIWSAARFPDLPVRQLAGTAAGIVGLVLSGLAMMG